MLACTLLLTGCGIPGIPSFGVRSYRNYSVEEAVDRLVISYDSGEVKVEVDNGSDIRIHETISGLIIIPVHISYEVKDGCLFIENGSLPIAGDLATRTLTVHIPQKYAWKDCQIKTKSGGIIVNDVFSESISLHSTSGGIRGKIRGGVSSLDVKNTSGGISLEVKDSTKNAVIKNTSGGIRIKMGTVEELQLTNPSGGIHLELLEDAGKVCAQGTSGGIRVTAKDIDSLEMKAKSGSLRLDAASVGNLVMHSSSGSSKAKLKNMGGAVDMQSGSGSVTLQLPKEAGFTATVTQGSGSFRCDFPTVMEAGRYLCGDGSCKLTLQAGSGRIRILAD